MFRKLLQAFFALILILAVYSVINLAVGPNNSSDKDSITTIAQGPQPDNSAALQQTKEPEPDKSANMQSNDGQAVPQQDPKPPVKKTPTVNNNTSASGYLIDVSIADQKVRIYKNSTLIKEWIVSTGENGSTPLGRYTIQNRGEWFFSEKYQEGAKWWVSFKDWGVYLFHTVPMDRNKNVIQSEADRLGTPASHGCIRLEIENAKWIYDNIPQGTPVNIHN